jgi:alpha-beta hydrolase superfamily lysophospholipase
MHGSTTSTDGTILHYDLLDAPSRGLVLIVPGFWRDRRHSSMTALAGRLQSRGIRSAVMDSRGHGESGGTFGFNHHEHEDVAAVIRALLEERPEITGVTLMGFSYGGAISISTAARHSELPIASLLLVSPVADFALIAPRFNLLTMHRHIAFSQALRRPRFVWRVRRSGAIRALDDMPRVRVPVCLIHVKDDWLIGHRHSVALYGAAGEPRELHLLDIPGNYHADRVFNVASAEVEPIVDNFLASWTPA